MAATTETDHSDPNSRKNSSNSTRTSTRSPTTENVNDCNGKKSPTGDRKLPKTAKSTKAVKEEMTRVVVVALTPDRTRETWDKKVEFLLAVVGFAVDLGNVWRFPYICYQNGGGAFLIPYTIMLIFGGLPLFYMELALGQFHRSGCLTIWKRICPAIKGVGYAICLMDIYMGMYYNTIIGWAVYYLIASFQSELPWVSCHNRWNTPDCRPVTSLFPNVTASSPAREFFEREVLEQYKADSLNRMGPIKPALALCVFSVFVLVYFSLWKGVRSTGKAVWITALAPYVVLIILLIRGVSLPGAANGIRYYLTPEWHKLYNSKVWIDAAAQIFFSLGPGFGTLLALSSYNKFNNNCYRDALLTSTINCLTSFLAGFVIFSVLGYMAHVQHKNIDQVGLEGPGLVFIVYPEAIATMSGSVFWSIIFFLMLITLGLDSTFGGLEAMITALCDEYPRTLGRHREIFVACLLFGIYICALPTTTYGGVYLVNLLNVYGPGLSILFVVFVEAAGVFWVYGTDNFARDVEKMIGHRPGLFWRLCWKYISPVFILVIFVFSLLNHEQILGNEYEYPEWAFYLGYALTASSLLCIPLYIVYKFAITPGSFIQELGFQSSFFYVTRFWFIVMKLFKWISAYFEHYIEKVSPPVEVYFNKIFTKFCIFCALICLSLVPATIILIQYLFKDEMPNFLLWAGENRWMRTEIGPAGQLLENAARLTIPSKNCKNLSRRTASAEANLFRSNISLPNCVRGCRSMVVLPNLRERTISHY